MLDASALLAVVHQESGAGVVLNVRHRVVSAVNLAEVATKLLDRGFPEAEAWQSAMDLVQEIVDFDLEQSRMTAALRPLTRACGLSLGDRACIALAQSLKLPVLTADKAWARLKLGIKIEVIR